MISGNKMKFLVVLALCAAVASANLIGPISAIDEQAEIKEIIAAINSPSTDPTTAAALQQMLNELLGLDNIAVGPAIVEDNEYVPISVGPAIVDEQVAAPASSPLVQIIINVKPNSGIAGNPVVIEGLPVPGPAIVDEIEPSPVIVVDQPESVPEPVIVVDQPEPEVEPVVVEEEPLPSPAPPSPPSIIPPVVPLPGILN